MNHDLPWLEEELAAHSQWVRRLARSLVHDESAAEDLVQDTWVRALARPPSDRRALRSWLARVVRTLAWKQHRRAAQAPASAFEEELPDGTPGAELVERLELHRVLAEELRAIREPLRTTLLQRYFEGRSAAEIAQREGIPAPTVRWRLQQGLEELRARLDARFGGKRETWMSALAFALPAKGAVVAGTGAALGGSGVAIGEGVLMSTLVKISLGAAVLVAAVMLALPFVAKDDTSTTAVVAKSSDLPLSQPEQVSTLSGEEATRESSRTTVVGPSTTLAKDPPLDSALARITARVLDEQRNPLPDGWIEVETKPVARASAIRDGTVTLELDEVPFRRVEVRVGATDRVRLSTFAAFELGKTTYIGDVLLPLGATVRGEVVDPDGHGLGGLEVLAVEATHVVGPPSESPTLRPSEIAASASGKSAGDGRFELRGVAPGSTRIWARTHENQWLMSPVVELQAPALVEGVVVRFQPDQDGGGLVHGIVLDPDGKPLASVDVRIRGPRLEQDSVQTNSLGQFHFSVGSKGPYVVEASLRGSSAPRRYSKLIVGDVVPGPQLRRYQLTAPRSMRLELFRDGAPCKEGWVAPQAAGKGTFTSTGARQAEGAGENVLDLPLPSGDFKLKVGARGCAVAELGPFTIANAPETLRVDLEPLAMITGHVIANGKPVAGAEVLLGEIVPSEREGRVGRFVSFVIPNSMHESTRGRRPPTGSDGRFEMAVTERNDYHLFVEAPGYARADFGPLTLDPATPTDDIKIELDAGGTLTGRVLVAEGQSPAGVIVGINRADGAPRTQRVGPDGQFSFEHLTAGHWELSRAHEEEPEDHPSSSICGGGMVDVLPRKPVFAPNCTIAVGQTTRQDLDLRDDQPCVLQGALTVDGNPAAGWSIALEWRTDSNMLWGERQSAATSNQGQFGLVAEDPVRWIVEIATPASVQPRLRLDAVLELKPGPNPWSPQLTTTRVEGKSLGDHPQGLAYRSHPDGFLLAEIHFKAAKGESFTLPMVPVGAGEIIGYAVGSPEPLILATFTATAGQTTHVEIP